MMFWLVPFVHAAAPMATIGGLGSAHVVVLLVQRGEVATAVPCRDDGAGGDAAADGRWSCSPLPSAGAAEVGVAYDARFALAGQVEIGESLAVTVTGSGVTVGTDAGGVPGGPPGNAPPRALFLTRVTGLGSGPAPVLRLQAQGGSSELVCRDDGVFPDRGRNDGEHGCLGPAPASESAEVFLNGVEGGSSFGQVSWGPAVGLLQLEVDATAHTSRIVQGALPPFVVAAPVEETPPEPEPPPEGEPEAGVPPPPPEGTAEGGTPPPGAEAPVLAKPPEPEAAVDTTPVPVPPTWMVLGIAAFVGAAWAFRSRPRPLPETLRAHPTPPLLPGGPGPGDTPCAFVAEDPPALAAAVLPALARQRRVILVSRTWSAFAPLAEGPVYRSASDDCEEVEVAARALAAIPGAPVAVLVVGEEALVEPGAVKPDPFKRLRDGLPAGVWLGVVVAKEAPAGFPCWTASGPPFVLRGS